jgi:hypothetical protein
MNRLFSAVLTAVVAITVAGCGGVVTANHSGSGGGGGSPDTSLTIASVSPNSGPVSGGTSVTITGTKFVSGARVSFGSLEAQTVTVSSETEIRTVTPRAVADGAVDVTVRNPDGQSGTLRAGFLYTSGAGSQAPTITSISPTSGSTDGGTSVQLTGRNFLTGAVVFFGTVTAPTATVDSTTQIHAITPAQGEGTVDVTVRNSDGQSAVLAHTFNYAPTDPDPPPSGNDSLLAGRTPANFTVPAGWTALLADGFETGDYSKWSWTCCSGTPGSIFINSNPAFNHSGGFSAGMHYVIPSSQHGEIDNDMRPGLTIAQQTHLYISGWVYFRNNGTNVNTTDPNGIARKLIYLKALDGAGAQTYWFIVGIWAFTGDTSPGSFAIGWCADSVAAVGCVNQYFASGIAWDRWYQLELEIQESTPGQSNGFYNLYVNGQLIKNHSGIMNRVGRYSNGVNDIEVGNQVNRFDSVNIDEYRYWDDVIILKK